MNAVEREPVETRVLNPTASEASYKPKQRSYRKTNLKKKVLAPDSPGTQMSGAKMSSAQTAAPKRTDPKIRISLIHREILFRSNFSTMYPRPLRNYLYFQKSYPRKVFKIYSK